MSRYHSYAASAKNVIEKYKGSEPFSGYLKKFFSADKKYGSKDRKMIAELCYGYFRCAHAFPSLNTEEKIIRSRFLLQPSPDPLLSVLHPEFVELMSASLQDKCTSIGIATADIFPFEKELSPQIDRESFFQSLLQQPDTFLRIRNNKKNVELLLEKASIPYSWEGTDTIRLSHSVKLDDVLKINRDVVVQDICSQHVLDGIDPSFFSDTIDVWDCCAASGGKSLLAYDRFKGKLRLSVSDVREKIIINLKNRMQKARVPLYKAFVADATQFTSDEQYDLIICDAPCTGSGTWARTPEQLSFFSAASIEKYATLQKNILQKSWESLKPGGYYCYITCSVFTKENEANADVINALGGSKIYMQYHTGYHKKADTLFSAVFKKSIA